MFDCDKWKHVQTLPSGQLVRRYVDGLTTLGIHVSFDPFPEGISLARDDTRPSHDIHELEYGGVLVISPSCCLVNRVQAGFGITVHGQGLGPRYTVYRMPDLGPWDRDGTRDLVQDFMNEPGHSFLPKRCFAFTAHAKLHRVTPYLPVSKNR
jgi:hypothetical protein